MCYIHCIMDFFLAAEKTKMQKLPVVQIERISFYAFVWAMAF